ncbi:MAG: hypothetical protein R3E01_00745 [Pirellulaceae bacterium]
MSYRLNIFSCLSFVVRQTNAMLALGIAVGFVSQALAQRPVVPGTGAEIPFVGDTFTDEDWNFVQNGPKSSRENNEQAFFPLGYSTNDRWFEGPERGYPDLLKVVETPASGLDGSKFSLMIRTLHSGVPGGHSFDVQQDDLVVKIKERIGAIPASEVPSVVTRVYLPPADQWENRTGPHFGFRITTGLVTDVVQEDTSRFRFRGPKTVREYEQYWPGIWVHFKSETDRNVEKDSAFLTVRGNRLGRDFHVKDISVEEFGWWTLGMSVTADGMIHYYASPGVDELTKDDYLTSQFPYSYRAEKFETMFFNICNRNDGKTWSTPFLIDDPQLFVMHANRVQSIVGNKERAAAEQARRQEQRRQQQAEQQQRAQQQRNQRR